MHDDLQSFLSAWDDSYTKGMRQIPLFEPAVTRLWTRAQQQRLVQLFFHIRGRFGEILLELGNAAPDVYHKDIILDNLRDEFGGNGPTHRELFLRLARALECDLSREHLENRYNLPLIEQYNQVQLKSIAEQGWTRSFIAFAAGERLDYIDYAALQDVFASFGVHGDDLAFFMEHMQAEHFAGALADTLAQEWDNSPQTVALVFNAVRQFQLAMWRNLSQEIVNYPGTALPSATPSTDISTARSSYEALRQAGESGLHYDPSKSPALATKFTDVVALDAGNGELLKLRLDAQALQRIRDAQSTSDWGRHVLVFGGNGFVGAHFIHALLCHPRVHRVTAIVRPRAGMTLLERILITWRQYDLNHDAVDLAKLQVLEGAMYAPNFGLTLETYHQLAASVDSVIQSAGSTDYVPGYLELRTEWVLGLLGVVQFCFERRTKRLNYIGSTIARLYDTPADFQRPDSWWYSGYAQMKWVNQLILGKLAALGFPALVCEAPYVLGSTTVGKDPGFHYSFWRAVSFGALLQMVWDGYFLDFTAVDLLVEAVLKNAFAVSPLRIIRPTAPYRVHNAEIAALLGCKIVPWEIFRQEVKKYVTAGQLSLLSDDAPAGIERVHFPPIYPESLDVSGFPPAQQLARLYLKNLDLLDARELFQVAGTRLPIRQRVGVGVHRE